MTQLLGATRYVKKFSKFLNAPKHESHNRLEEDEKVYLKTSLQSSHPRPCKLTFSNLLALLGSKTQIFKTTIKQILHYNVALLNRVFLSQIWPVL